MDNIYNNFYAYDEGFCSSNSEDDFQTYRRDELIQDIQELKENKNLCGTVPSTSNTLNNFTQYSNPQHFFTDKKVIQIEPSIHLDKNTEKNSKPKNQRVYNIIKTSTKRLQKTVKSYRGDRQQTMNLNKYYSTCLKDYLQTLATCNIIQSNQMQKYEKNLKTNEISEIKLESVAADYCQQYIQSSQLISAIFKSNKMQFYNKIITLKYAQGFKDKVINKARCKKQWKNIRD